MLNKPDPRFTHGRRARSNFTLALKMSLWLLAAMWLVLIVDSTLGLGLQRFGLRPGNPWGTIGILTAPMLHAGVQHLLSNSLPLVISMTAALYLYPSASLRALPVIWLGSGALAWVIGRPSLHFGASGLVYGLLAFVFVSGVLRRDMRSVSVSLMVWFLYGSMIWGVLPIRAQMSWEMHLTGAIMGLLMAVLMRKRDHVPIVRYEWEDDDSVPEWYPEELDEDKPEQLARWPGNDDENER